jgi:hypothetical protein
LSSLHQMAQVLKRISMSLRASINGDKSTNVFKNNKTQKAHNGVFKVS